MDFARKQLEKYGWSDGKGLGKHENGIAEALKPKIKRSVTGVGHDPASEFNEHWWSALYDKAAKNVEVEEKNGKTKKIKIKDSENFVITSSNWKINKKQSKNTDEAQYSEYFVRTAVLTNDKGGRKTENVKESESESDGDVDSKNVIKMTDEELFAACGGRTAHKGARHGLRAIGKLARIAEQERNLLTQPQYEGYSHAKKLKQEADYSIDQMTIKEDMPEIVKKKKNKRKRCSSKEAIQLVESESSLPTKNKLKSKKNRDASADENGSSNSEEQMIVCSDVNTDVKKSRKNKRKNENNQADDSENINSNGEVPDCKKKKKKKKDKSEQMDCC